MAKTVRKLSPTQEIELQAEKEATLKDLAETFEFLSSSDRNHLKQILIRGLRKALSHRLSTRA